MGPEKLKEVIKEALKDAEVVIAYKEGFDKLHSTPCFVTTPEEADAVIFDPRCVQNLASYLPSLKKKAAVVVKGCDSRTIVQYMQEALIDRGKVTVIGIPCTGIVSIKKVMAKTGHQPILDVTFPDKNTVVVKTPKGEQKMAMADVAADKCGSCLYPTPVVYDQLVGEPIESDKTYETAYKDVAELAAKSLEEKKAYWEKEFDRCIRCYACRNACPMCVCQDSCIAESRDPHWISQKSNPTEKFMFHMIHALHLAGRCVECGECERACPMGIPVNMLKRKINQDMKELYDYEPGVKPEDKPPMFTFSVEEKKIEEHKL
ncbi:MAG TPA: 4Fe-4S dicluster domain-containing protein [Syntrophorhabdaceae bacterium]